MRELSQQTFDLSLKRRENVDGSDVTVGDIRGDRSNEMENQSVRRGAFICSLNQTTTSGEVGWRYSRSRHGTVRTAGLAAAASEAQVRLAMDGNCCRDSVLLEAQLGVVECRGSRDRKSLSLLTESPHSQIAKDPERRWTQDL
jgi:hypothetical protein